MKNKNTLTSKLITFGAVALVGFGAIAATLLLEKAVVSVDQTTIQTKVTSAYVKRSSAKSSDKYIITLQNGKVLEITDLWSLGQVESARLFGQMMDVVGKECEVTVTYGGFDNPWLSLHPRVIESKTNLTCN